MNPDLDTLATALYVTVDDLLLAHPQWVPERPAVGIVPKLSDSELVTLAVIQALLGYVSEARFLRYARAHLRPWFPYLPTRSAYNKRLRRSSGMMQHIINYLSRLSPSFRDSLWAMQFTTRKSGYIVGVAEAMAAGGLTGLEDDGNETVIRRLVELRGVGRWTAEWFLARCVARPDVVPAGDLGVRKVVSRYVMGADKGEVLPEPDVRAAVESWGDGGNWAIHLLLERWAEEHAR